MSKLRTDAHRMLISSKTNLDKKKEMFGNMCKELKLVLGGGPGQLKANMTEKDKKVTNEQMAKKEEEDTFITVNGYRYYRNNSRGNDRGEGHGRGEYNRGSRGGKPYERPTQL